MVFVFLDLVIIIRKGLLFQDFCSIGRSLHMVWLASQYHRIADQASENLMLIFMNNYNHANVYRILINLKCILINQYVYFYSPR